MSIWLKIFYKLINLVLNILVKSKSIPKDPINELGLDISLPIIYILSNGSKVDLLTLRQQCLFHELPDPLEPIIINNVKLSRYIFTYEYSKIFRQFSYKEKLNKLFQKYINLHLNNHNLNIQILLISVMLGRRPEREKNYIYSKLNVINNLQKLLSVMWLGRDNFIHFSNSISLRLIINKYGTDATIIQKLLRVVRIYFARQRLAAIGPSLQTRQSLFNKLLSSKAIVHAIADEARNKKISYDKAKQNAILLMKEIAANFSYEMIRITDRILRFTWNRLYKGIHVSNVSNILQLAHEGREIVYIPCHRSHMDYLLISYVLYHNGLVPPHIAAGINLNFWPAGPIFRRLGAFFIRRTFKGNKLYSVVFREYLSELFNRGCSVEYFIEGGRSRTGRLLDPKTGTLSMTIQAMLRGKARPITLVPIYIGYEHIIEVSTYTRELKGAIKEKENLIKMLIGLSRLCNLGKGYVNFGEPISLISYLNKHVSNWRNSINLINFTRPIWLTKVVNNIANDLMIRINNAGAVNAMNLCCTALLASNKNSLTRKQLKEQLDCYLNIMRNIPYSDHSTVPLVSTSDLIDHALKMKKFEIKKDVNDDRIILPRSKAISMSYYRNNITHMLILPSLMATIFTQYQHVSHKKLLHDIYIIYPMLKAELFLRWQNHDLGAELDKLIKELLRQKLVTLKKDKLYINPIRFRILKLLAANTREIIQRYAITFWLLSKNPSINKTILERKSQKLAQYISISHNINTTEFSDRAVFSTLILTLRKEGYLSDANNITNKRIIKVYQILARLIASDVRSTIENTNLYLKERKYLFT